MSWLIWPTPGGANYAAVAELWAEAKGAGGRVILPLTTGEARVLALQLVSYAVLDRPVTAPV